MLSALPADCDTLPVLVLFNCDEHALSWVCIDPPKNWHGHTPAVRLIPGASYREAPDTMVVVSPRS